LHFLECASYIVKFFFWQNFNCSLKTWLQKVLSNLILEVGTFANVPIIPVRRGCDKKQWYYLSSASLTAIFTIFWNGAHLKWFDYRAVLGSISAGWSAGMSRAFNKKKFLHLKKSFLSVNTIAYTRRNSIFHLRIKTVFFIITIHLLRWNFRFVTEVSSWGAILFPNTNDLSMPDSRTTCGRTL